MSEKKKYWLGKIHYILSNEYFSLFFIAIGFCLILFGGIFFMWAEKGFSISKEIDSEKFGQFGDFIGGIVGAIWALAGVILFYVALNEQRKDFKTNQEALNLQVEALNQQIVAFDLQRKEMEESRKVYEEQSKILRIQQFESNFYSLLNVYLTIKNNLNNLVENKDFFKTLYDKSHIDTYSLEMPIVNHHKNMVEIYIKLFNTNRGHLSHYFKSFYRIVKIIDSTVGFDEKEKVFYSKILRSQLTDYEQLVLYYNSHSYYGEKTRYLILKYNLLKHTPIFYKPEFSYFQKIQNGFEILNFAERFNLFLAKHINDFYDISYEQDKVEENFDDLNCIVGIYFYDNIELKVFCNTDISLNNIRLTDEEFSEFLNCLVYDKLIFNTYLELDKALLTKFKTDTPKGKIFGITIETDAQLSVTGDRY